MKIIDKIRFLFKTLRYVRHGSVGLKGRIRPLSVSGRLFQNLSYHPEDKRYKARLVNIGETSPDLSPTDENNENSHSRRGLSSKKPCYVKYTQSFLLISILLFFSAWVIPKYSIILLFFSGLIPTILIILFENWWAHHKNENTQTNNKNNSKKINPFSSVRRQ